MSKGIILLKARLAHICDVSAYGDKKIAGVVGGAAGREAGRI
jgi:hypothetical protein